MKRLKVTATVDQELIEWIDEEVKKKRFRNRSHAIEYALAMLKQPPQPRKLTLSEEMELRRPRY
jgi:Arc/MetJ-type ribon-helix-helix transcriptional regulator